MIIHIVRFVERKYINKKYLYYQFDNDIIIKSSYQIDNELNKSKPIVHN